MTESLLIAKSGKIELSLLSRMANRHGLIAGATGTGKTITLQSLAEQFSRNGVPVFMADVKGDLSGAALPGGGNAKVDARIKELKLQEFAFDANPVVFWDVFGEKGHPMRATVSDMGPLLLSRMLNLNDTQAGVLTAMFKIADDNGWLLLDLKDLRAMLQYAAEHAGEFTSEYGNISVASVGAIQRGLLQLEHEGGDKLFGEPALNFDDLMQTDEKGCGVINILAAETLYNSPRAYATLLLWLLSELFEKLPEVGDLDQPKLVFFFDEAHLLFNDAPPALLSKIEQVVRLIRSKGVGVYFVSQNPLDIPDVVLGQLGNRIQHALRAFTPRDQKAVKSAAETFRANPKLDVETAITELGVGEALVSLLDDKGRPAPVERALIIPPGSRIGPANEQERRAVIQASLLYGHYEKAIDRESAYEILKGRAAQTPEQPPAEESRGFDWGGMLGGEVGPRGGRGRQGVLEAAAKSIARTIGAELGRQIVRGVLGSILGSKR
ncbi:ATP-binding protein [Novimethylophilus kurashikiensis]|uniref:ATP-binding protein n=1 Tax=Novimethylophilus kurashikiensis TaxID=1825523 RepID=A0A2R5F539_9PROT|nr:helicase HerA-like domain-containing protein [Novimethylophilus kurashikiensis]GBG12798.1 ATP-binding protein [Novimethylophilus kurashikiensis]